MYFCPPSVPPCSSIRISGSTLFSGRFWFLLTTGIFRRRAELLNVLSDFFIALGKIFEKVLEYESSLREGG